MQTLTRSNLKAYVRHCRELVRDINHVLGDRRLESQKWTFEYAVDFSEVFGYVLPQEAHESWSFEGLMALTEEEKLRQFRVLAHFFSQDKIYLPAPYAIELRTFYDRLRLDSVNTMMDQAKLALDEIVQLRGNQHVQRLLLSATSDQPIDDAEKTAIVDFLKENASSLRAFNRGVALDPLRRLKKLLHKKRLVDLGNEKADARLDLPVVQERYQRLLKQRNRKDEDPGAAASFLDSVAMELLRRANLAAASSNRRVLLVSRSSHLMRLVEHEVELGLWPGIGDIVRHPRTFDPICRPPGGWTPGHAKDLERRRESLRLFVRAASAALHRNRDAAAAAALQSLDSEFVDESHDSENEIADPGLKGLLDDVQRDWLISENLATALEHDPDGGVAETDDEKLVSSLLQLIERADLIEMVTDQLTEIFADLNRGHEDLGFHLQKRAADRTYGHLVYPLEFDDKDLREQSERISRDWRVSLGEAFALFQKARTVGSNYDRLLATALSLAALGRWQVAEDYVKRALLEVERRSGEAKLLLALCIRTADPDLKRLREAMELIEEAIAEQPNDPRYLKEKATIQLRWNRLAHQPGGDDFRTKDLPTFPQIEANLIKAKEHTNDSKLIAQIRNNLCYMYISPPIENRAAAIENLKELERILTEAFPDPATWPVLMHDTIVMAKFRLYKQESRLDQLEAWARQLTGIAKSDELGENDCRRVERHAEEVRSHIRDLSQTS